MDLMDGIDSLKGIGPKKTEALRKLNISKIEDLLYLYPRDYQDRRNVCEIKDLVDGKAALIKAEVKSAAVSGYRYGRKQMLRLIIDDGTMMAEVIFFNAKYFLRSFEKGREYSFYGVPKISMGKIRISHPDFSVAGGEEDSGIIPIYPLTAGISQREMRRWQKIANSLLSSKSDYLPNNIIEKNKLCSLQYALDNIHFPEDKQKLLEAKYRLVFDELFVLQLGLLKAKRNNTADKKAIKLDSCTDIKSYTDKLPYELTEAQRRVTEEILHDMEASKAMNRLVQGDVGSGKTAVAETALYRAVKCGYQGAFMAPTELLAKQHYKGLKKSFESHDIKVDILIGSMTAKEKRDVLERLKSGKIDILIGTHALLQPDVEFKDLALVITDEQHRFGVDQREKIRKKGSDPHVLVMTATPIPRTLAVILYGDLDISVIDQLPPGRQKITTKALDHSKREKMYGFVRSEIEKGRQAYVVAPLIGESDVLDVTSAEELFAELKDKFKDCKTELLHGEMKPAQKNSIMSDFYSGKTDILVSTVVIEVGIDVPNATVMVIENAERFGLAQLHQLRGRIGRGKHSSYCFLVNEGTSEIAIKRAEIMMTSQDGFYIAEEDLKLRGPGELFGTRQHGIPDLHMADLVRHIKILDKVKEEAETLLERDGTLEQPENKKLKARIERMFGKDMTLKI